MTIAPQTKISNIVGDIIAAGFPKGPTLARAVTDAGYGTVSKIRRASDDELRRVPGVGPRALVVLRKVTKQGGK